MLTLFLALALLAPGPLRSAPDPPLLADLTAPASPPLALCPPVVWRDYVTPVGYQAVVRVELGCTRGPARLRERNFWSGAIGATFSVPLGQVTRRWLFTRRLEYTLDGVTWRPVVPQ